MLRLSAMRAMYEPQCCAVAEYLGMGLPGWSAEENAKDQWLTVNRLREQAEAVLGQVSENNRAHPMNADEHDH